MADEIALLVDGVPYGGWSDASITKRLDSLSGAFDLTLTDNWTKILPLWPFRAGSLAIVSIVSDLGVPEPVITGFIDSVSPSFDKNDHKLELSGRDRASDLIDCSIDLPNSDFKGLTLFALATMLCAPFGITVTNLSPDPGIIPIDITIEQGEGVYEILDRYAKIAGKLFISEGPTGIVMTMPGLKPAIGALIEGQNILSADGWTDYSERFATYTVKGQMAANDAYFGVLANQAIGKAFDPSILRYRPKVIIAETGVDFKQALQRASWEATMNAARSIGATITVQGWRQMPLGGPIWRINELVPVRSRRLGINDVMLINAVTFNVDASGGRTTTLELVPKTAYLPIPFVPPDTPPGSTFDVAFDEVGE